MRNATVVQIYDASMSHKIGQKSFLKYDSLLKGSTTGTSIKIINSTVKQNLI